MKTTSGPFVISVLNNIINARHLGGDTGYSL